jgi:hypothetical protein
VRRPAFAATALLEMRSEPAPTTLVDDGSVFSNFVFRNLLQSELDGDRQMHGYRLAIEHCGLILPLAKRFHGRLM